MHLNSGDTKLSLVCIQLSVYLDVHKRCPSRTVACEVGNQGVRTSDNSNPGKQDRFHHKQLPNGRHAFLVTDDFFYLFHTLLWYKSHGRVFVFQNKVLFSTLCSKRSKNVGGKKDSSWNFALESRRRGGLVCPKMHSRRKNNQKVYFTAKITTRCFFVTKMNKE